MNEKDRLYSKERKRASRINKEVTGQLKRMKKQKGNTEKSRKQQFEPWLPREERAESYNHKVR
jgi:hypothetical protein